MNGLVETCDSPRSIAAPTVSEKLANEEKVLTERLEKVREVRLRMAENPEVQKMIDCLSALGQFHY